VFSDRRQISRMPPLPRRACSRENCKASVTSRRASRKLLLPEPFGPTKKARGPNGTRQKAMLL